MKLRQAALAALIGGLAGAGIALAQRGLAPGGTPRADPPGQRVVFGERFTSANLSRDRALNPDPLPGGRSFAAGLLDSLDRTHKGYVTFDDIKSYYAAQEAARHVGAGSTLPR
jgi:hypothetical protein